MIKDYDKFLKNLSTYWIAEGRNKCIGQMLFDYLSNSNAEISIEEFKKFLSTAIIEQNISISDYEEITGLDCADLDEISEDLTDLWRQTFGNEPIPNK